MSERAARTGTPQSEYDVRDLLTEAKIGPRDGAGKLAVVAMSGGVDSAVTALLMRERGYRVVGMNLRLFTPSDPVHSVNPCCGIPAMDDARATCQVIGVPFYAINMEAEFGEAVINRFVDEYAAGRTPNPCLECNRHVKFRHLVHRAKLLGAHTLATGHYARIERGAPHRLFRAVDARKDQSYVLHTLTPEQLDFIQFPLGNLTKPEVRQLARHFGLPVAEKEESQEICFVGKGSYADFVARRRPDVTPARRDRQRAGRTPRRARRAGSPHGWAAPGYPHRRTEAALCARVEHGSQSARRRRSGAGGRPPDHR